MRRAAALTIVLLALTACSGGTPEGRYNGVYGGISGGAAKGR